MNIQSSNSNNVTASGTVSSSTSSPTESNPATKSKRRILLVDDDNDILEVLTQVLCHGDFEVIQAHNGEEGLRKAVEEAPDLALLDVTLDGMSGLDLAQQLQSETPVPFMFLSKHGDIEIVRQAAKFGAVGYLVKPVDPMQILPSVESALARADEISELRRKGEHLTTALETGRKTSMAVGLLMAKHHVDHTLAFEILRDFARSNRRKIVEVAHDLLEAEKLINSFIPLFAAKKKTK